MLTSVPECYNQGGQLVNICTMSATIKEVNLLTSVPGCYNQGGQLVYICTWVLQSRMSTCLHPFLILYFLSSSPNQYTYISCVFISRLKLCSPPFLMAPTVLLSHLHSHTFSYSFIHLFINYSSFNSFIHQIPSFNSLIPIQLSLTHNAWRSN